MRRRWIFLVPVLLFTCLVSLAGEGAYETSDDATAFPDLLPSDEDSGTDILMEYWNTIRDGILPALDAARSSGKRAETDAGKSKAANTAGTGTGTSGTGADGTATETPGQDKSSPKTETAKQAAPTKPVVQPAAPVAPAAPTAPAATGAAKSGSTASPSKAASASKSGTDPAVSAGPSSPTVPAVSGVAVQEETPTRELKVRKGDEVTISLEGSGWIFLGEKLARSGLVFKQRELGAEKADFRFTAREPGEYMLSFQRQLLTTGGSSKELIRVTVADPAVQASGGSSASTAASSSGVSPSILTAPGMGVETSGTTPAASGAASTARSSDTGTAGKTSAGSGTAAAKGTGSSIPAAGASGGAAGSPVPANESLPAVAALPMSPAEEADFTLKNGGAAAAVAFIENWLSLNSADSSADQLLFRLAGYFENEKAVRDLRKSVTLYRKILTDYPFSTYYDAAAERLEYLTRHFFYLR